MKCIHYNQKHHEVMEQGFETTTGIYHWCSLTAIDMEAKLEISQAAIAQKIPTLPNATCLFAGAFNCCPRYSN